MREERTQIRPAFQLLGTENETLLKEAAFHLRRLEHDQGAFSLNRSRTINPVGKFGTFGATLRSVYI